MRITFFSEESDYPFTYITSSLEVGPLPCPYHAVENPNIFLEFALDDRKASDTRALVNAFSNIKKALHLRVDMLLHQYGLFHYYRNKKFPEKLKMLDKIGIMPTTMIRNLNKERNLLEHEYIIPNPERVDEALDVTQLLYLASEKLLEKSVCEAVVGYKSPSTQAILRLEPNCGEICFYELIVENDKIRVFNDFGIEYISSPLRLFITGEMNPGIMILEVPFKKIILNKENEEEWLPIIKLLISISKERSSIYGSVQSEGGYYSTSLRLPITEFESKKLAEFLSGSLGKNDEKD